MMDAAISGARAAARTEYYLAVIDPDTFLLVGFVRLALGGVKSAKLGSAIHADHQGHGSATDAARTLIRHGFDQLGVHRVTAAVGPDNHAQLASSRYPGFPQHTGVHCTPGPQLPPARGEGV